MVLCKLMRRLLTPLHTYLHMHTCSWPHTPVVDPTQPPNILSVVYFQPPSKSSLIVWHVMFVFEYTCLTSRVNVWKHVCGRCLSLTTLEYTCLTCGADELLLQQDWWSSMIGGEQVISCSKWCIDKEGEQVISCCSRWTGDLLLQLVNRWFLQQVISYMFKYLHSSSHRQCSK